MARKSSEGGEVLYIEGVTWLDVLEAEDRLEESETKNKHSYLFI